MPVFLLSKSVFDFETYFKLCKELTGESASTKLDRSGLGLNNNGLVNALDAGFGQHLVAYTYLVVVDDLTIMDVLSLSLTKKWFQTKKRNIYGVLLTGTLTEWSQALETLEQSSDEGSLSTAKELRDSLALLGHRNIKRLGK